MISEKDFNDFYALRKKLLDALSEASTHDPGKMYEGEIELSFNFTGIYDNEDKVEGVTIKAHFYLIGPYRHYEWHGRTFAEAIKKADSDISTWIEEAKEIYDDDFDNG